jgi:hypothetical protein
MNVEMPTELDITIADIRDAAAWALNGGDAHDTYMQSCYSFEDPQCGTCCCIWGYAYNTKMGLQKSLDNQCEYQYALNRWANKSVFNGRLAHMMELSYTRPQDIIGLIDNWKEPAQA